MPGRVVRRAVERIVGDESEGLRGKGYDAGEKEEEEVKAKVKAKGMPERGHGLLHK
jgi:hypothetical protein